MFDCHVHSKFSCDSNLTLEAACDKAIEIGLSGIAFVDHLDFDFPGFGDEFLIDFDEYSFQISKIKEKYRNKLKVLKGIEVGIQPHVIEDSLSVVKKHDFDYVIASVHIIDGQDPYKKQFYPKKTKSQAYSRYLEEILFMVRNFNDFDICGHFTYIIRYPNYDDRTLRYHEHSDLFDTILKQLISRGKGFEINTGSFKETIDGRTVPEYDINILKRYKELGGEIICLGSDAHHVEFIGYKFSYFKDMISKAGFKYLTYYENRKPVFIPL